MPAGGSFLPPTSQPVCTAQPYALSVIPSAARNLLPISWPVCTALLKQSAAFLLSNRFFTRPYALALNDKSVALITAYTPCFLYTPTPTSRFTSLASRAQCGISCPPLPPAPASPAYPHHPLRPNFPNAKTAQPQWAAPHVYPSFSLPAADHQHPALVKIKLPLP